MRSPCPLRSPRCALVFLTLMACTSGKVGGRDDTAPHSGETGPQETGIPVESPLTGLVGLGQMDVIVVHADTLRADHLVQYGYKRETSPFGAAAPRVAVSGYHAPAPWTLPSTASALLSRTPEHHGRVSIAATPEGLEWTSLAEALQDAGYTTAMYSGNQILTGDDVLAQGFDVRVGTPGLEDAEEQRLSALTAQAQDWIEALPEGQPYFVWLQPMDVHAPLRPEEPWRGTWADYEALPFDTDDVSVVQSQRFSEAWHGATSEEERAALGDNLVAVYDELVLQQDAALGELFAWLEAEGRAERTLVVLTSDHGETLGDDGSSSWSHMESLRPELVQIPLAFYNPQLEPVSVDCLSSNVDLAPTLLYALGLPALAGSDGQPLQERCREAAISSLYMNGSEAHDLLLASITDGRWRLEWNCTNGDAAAYDLAEDPAALRPLPPREVVDALALQELLQRWFDDASVSLGDLACRVPEL